MKPTQEDMERAGKLTWLDQRHIAQALADERARTIERCAKVAENEATKYMHLRGAYVNACNYIAAAIRKMGED